MFFLSGKKTSCAYGPDARVLKNIQIKRLQYSESVQLQLNSNKIDIQFLTNGIYLFKLNSCLILLISVTAQLKFGFMVCSVLIPEVFS